MTSSISNKINSVMTGLDASPTFERTVSSPAFGENSHLRPKDQAEQAWQRMNGEHTRVTHPGVISEIRGKASEAVDSIKEKASEAVDSVKEKLHLREQASPTGLKIRKEQSRQIIVQPTVSSHGIEQPVDVYPTTSTLPAPVRFDIILAKPKASPPKRLTQKRIKKMKSIKTTESKAPKMRDSPLRRMRSKRSARRFAVPDNRPLRLKVQNEGVSKARVHADIMREFKEFMRKEAPILGKPQESYKIMLSAPKSSKPVLSSKAPSVRALRPLSSKFLESRRRLPTLLRVKDVSQRVAMVRVQFKSGAEKIHKQIVKDFKSFMHTEESRIAEQQAEEKEFKEGAERVHRQIAREFKSFMDREESKIVDQWAEDREFQGEEYEAALQAFGVNDKHAPVIEGRIMTGRTLYTMPSLKAKESTIEGDFKLDGETVETTHGKIIEEKPDMSNFVAEALSKAQ